MTDSESGRSTRNLELTAADLGSMATAADDVADLVATTPGIASDNSSACSSDLSGWETAGEIRKVTSGWRTKAYACQYSLQEFAIAVRATRDHVTGTDEDNGIEFRFPEESLIPGDEPPWVRPVPPHMSPSPVSPPE